MKTLVIIVFLLNLIFCLLNILVGNFGSPTHGIQYCRIKLCLSIPDHPL